MKGINQPNLQQEQQNTERFSEQAILEVFELNPKLQTIGSLEQYTKYLETIFPESKVRDIVWHYSDAEFKNEGFKPVKPNFDTLNSLEGVYNFSTNRKFVQRYGENAYPSIVDIRHPMEYQSRGEYADDMDTPLSEALFMMGRQKSGNPFAPAYDESKKDTDGFVNNISGEEYFEKHPISGLEVGLPEQKIISVFDPSQIHILGSQADIKRFQEFVKGGK